MAEDTGAPGGDDQAEPGDDGKVVPIGKKKRATKAQKTKEAGTPPPANVGAGAPSKGTGGAAAAPAAKPAKPEKKIDWGKFNYLVEHYALIFGTDTVWDGAERVMMKIANMAHAHGSDMVRMWKGSEKRRTVRQSDVVFDPTNTCDAECVNLFGGIEMEPAAGDVGPIVDLMKFLTSRTSTDEVERDAITHWLTCWLAYPLQNVGTKLRSAVIMHGDEGAGKNFLFDLAVEIYGKCGALVGQDELEDKFNDWRSGKLLVIGDEVSSRAELVHNKNRLKALITSPTVQINPKNLPRREEKNHMNIVFLSNELQPLALDNSDRRYLVVYTPRARDFEYYRKLKAWRDNDGAARFYRYLLDYDTTGFDPFAPAPLTQAKSDLIDLNRKSPERFWLEWQSGLLDLPYQSCAVDQAFAAYLKYCQRIGDRFPLQKHVFSPMLQRFAEAQGKAVAVKVMNVAEPGKARKAYRMLLICPPIFGIDNDGKQETEGAWATETVVKFGEQLRKYTGGSFYPRSPSEEEQASRGGE